MAETHTDCRSEEGITVGLVDAIISICRILAQRDLSLPAVKEALIDLATDEDVTAVYLAGERWREEALEVLSAGTVIDSHEKQAEA